MPRSHCAPVSLCPRLIMPPSHYAPKWMNKPKTLAMWGWTEVVCVSVWLWRLYGLNGWPILMKFHTNSLEDIGQFSFSQILDLNLMTSWRPFCTFPRRHSHGRNVGPIFLKLGHNVAEGHPVFAVENQQSFWLPVLLRKARRLAREFRPK